MKLISFLGNGNYERCHYLVGEAPYETNLFPVALSHVSAPDQLLAMVTDAAKAKWFGPLVDAMFTASHYTEVIPVRIPDGKSEAELWEIFEAMAQRLDEGDEVMFDITHGYRSLPMLAFLACQYLSVVKHIRLAGVYYGAYEARDRFNLAPVFDMTAFADLAKWSAATQAYLKHGDARSLAELLGDQTRALARAAIGRGEAPPQHLPRLERLFSELANAVNLARPREVMDIAFRLRAVLPEAESEVRSLVPPLAVLLEKIRSDVSSIACADPGATEPGLAAQRRLVEWYAAKSMWMQAATLAREWVVSAVCFSCGLDWLAERDRIEAALNGNAIMKQGRTSNAPEDVAAALTALDPNGDITREWSRLSDLRNDINHAGMRREKTETAKLVRRIEKLPESLKRIADICGHTE